MKRVRRRDRPEPVWLQLAPGRVQRPAAAFLFITPVLVGHRPLPAGARPPGQQVRVAIQRQPAGSGMGPMIGGHRRRTVRLRATPTGGRVSARRARSAGHRGQRVRVAPVKPGPQGGDRRDGFGVEILARRHPIDHEFRMVTAFFRIKREIY